MILLIEKPATSTSTALMKKAAYIHRNSGSAVLPCRWGTRPLQLHIYQTARHHNPEDSNRVAHCCEGPKPCRNKEHPLAPTFFETQKYKKTQGLPREETCTVLYTSFCEIEGRQVGGGQHKVLSPRQASQLVYASTVSFRRSSAHRGATNIFSMSENSVLSVPNCVGGR